MTITVKIDPQDLTTEDMQQCLGVAHDRGMIADFRAATALRTQTEQAYAELLRGNGEAAKRLLSRALFPDGADLIALAHRCEKVGRAA